MFNHRISRKASMNSPTETERTPLADQKRRRARRAAAGAALLAVPLLFLLSINRQDPPDFAFFLGRFHPVLVHFPIVLLLFAAALEAVAARFRSLNGLRETAPFALALGTAGALAAAFAGYLLSLGGGYDTGAVTRHQWLGIGVAVGAVGALTLCAVARRTRSRKAATGYRALLFTTAGLVLLTGHLGGSLTHGQGYLTEYLPAPVQALTGWGGPRSGGVAIADIDSALVYTELIAPVLETRCVECHGASKSKGKLRLDSPEGLLKGGEDGPVVVAGQPEQSDLLRRITLPAYHEDVMPPDGAPLLPIGDTELIRWWIAGGGSFEQKVGEAGAPPPPVQTYLDRLSLPKEPLKTGIFALDVAPADTSAVAAAEKAGFIVQSLGSDHPFLYVAGTNRRESLTDASLSVLQPLALQIADLDLAYTPVTDAGLAAAGAMPHLTRLHLQHTTITDAGLARLKDLTYLTHLNLYGTKVTDAGLEHLASLRELRALFLWQTGVSEAGAERLRQALPQLTINLGSAFTPADTLAAVKTSL